MKTRTLNVANDRYLLTNTILESKTVSLNAEQIQKTIEKYKSSVRGLRESGAWKQVLDKGVEIE